jgi:hypothetical protein
VAEERREFWRESDAIAERDRLERETRYVHRVTVDSKTGRYVVEIDTGVS